MKSWFCEGAKLSIKLKYSVLSFMFLVSQTFCMRQLKCFVLEHSVLKQNFREAPNEGLTEQKDKAWLAQD